VVSTQRLLLPTEAYGCQLSCRGSAASHHRDSSGSTKQRQSIRLLDDASGTHMPLVHCALPHVELKVMMVHALRGSDLASSHSSISPWDRECALVALARTQTRSSLIEFDSWMMVESLLTTMVLSVAMW
jgi:hypothetical protein